MNQGHTRFETRTTDGLLTVTCLGCNLDLVFAPGAPLRQRETAMLLHAQNANAAPRERRSASADKWSAYASGEREAARELRRRGLAPISGGSDVWAVYSAAQQGDPSASRELRRRAQSARHAAIEVEAAERLPRRSRAQRKAHRTATKRQRRQARMTLRDAIAQAESEALAELSERGLPPISGGCSAIPAADPLPRPCSCNTWTPGAHYCQSLSYGSIDRMSLTAARAIVRADIAERQMFLSADREIIAEFRLLVRGQNQGGQALPDMSDWHQALEVTRTGSDPVAQQELIRALLTLNAYHGCDYSAEALSLPPISGGCELPPQSCLMVRVNESRFSETFDAECLDHRPQWRSAGNPTRQEAMLTLSEHVEHEHGAAMAHCVDCERVWMLSESQDGQLRCRIHADAWFGDRQCPICRDNLKTDGMTICRECAAETGRTPKALINRQAIDKQDVRLTDLFGQAPGVLLKAANFDRRVRAGIADSRPVAMPTQVADSRTEIRNEAGEWEYSHLGSVMDHLSLLIAALPAKGKFPKYAHAGQDWQVVQRHHNRQSPEQSRTLDILLPAGQALAYTSAHWSSCLSAITVNVSAAKIKPSGQEKGRS